MNQQIYTIETSPVNSFHKRVLVFVLGGMLLDGYILGIIEFAMLLMAPAMNMSDTWQGLIGAAPLIGIFIGCLLFGRVADTYGRKQIFFWNAVVMLVISALQFFSQTPLPIFIYRIILGVCIGIEYCVAPSMVTEFLPTKLRGPGLVLQGTLWTVGYVGAACIGYWLIGFGGDIWRPMLASSAIIALLVVLLRIGMPETPRWLVMHGQLAKAKMIVEKYFGPNVTIDNLQEEATRLHKQNHNNKVSYSMLFKNGMWKRTVFCGFSWLSTTIPLFGIFTFVPTILATLHVSDPHLGTLLINFTMLAGAIISTFIIDKFSRRGLAISTLIVTALPLLALGIWPTMGGVLVVAMFCVYILFGQISGNLINYVYPGELYPTEIRSTGVGFCAAVSRVGSALGTFSVPILLTTIGTGPILIIMAVLLFIATALAAAWAPETRKVDVG